jgi:hypothetical protein
MKTAAGYTGAAISKDGALLARKGLNASSSTSWLKMITKIADEPVYASI